MMRRLLVPVFAVGVVLGFVGTPDAAAQQSINFYVGGLFPRGYDSRAIDDVLVQNSNFLLFNIDDFKGVTGGAEYLVNLGNLFDAGLGVGYYSQTSPAIYADFTH